MHSVSIYIYIYISAEDLSLLPKKDEIFTCNWSNLALDARQLPHVISLTVSVWKSNHTDDFAMS